MTRTPSQPYLGESYIRTIKKTFRPYDAEQTRSGVDVDYRAATHLAFENWAG
jgi:hypothetical protein